MENSPVGAAAPGIDVGNPLELPHWDEEIARLPGAGFFHSSGWTRVLTDTYGYTPLHLVRRQAGQLHSVLPLLEVKSWLTGRRGVSLPFADIVEPLCPDEESFRLLFGAAQDLLRQRGWKYLECRGGRRWLPAAPASTSFLNHTLDLRPGAAALSAGLDESVRRAVRKAERLQLVVEFSQSLERMREFYGLLCVTRQRHGLPPQPFRFFANFQRHILAGNHGWVVLARQGDQAVAGAVFAHFGGDAIYKFGASDEKHQHLRANNLVMWRAIQRYAGEGFAAFDFGRTSLGNEGLRRFKLSWGAAEKTIGYVRYDRRSEGFVTARDEASGWYTRIFNRLPIPVSRLIGGFLYPHMG